MKLNVIFCGIILLLLASCGSKTQSDISDASATSVASSINCTPTKAWAVTKGDNKELVRQFMIGQDLDVTDEDSVLIGFGLNKVIWAATQWDMAIVKFDTHDKAKALSLMRGEPFDEITASDIASFFEVVWGESKFDDDLQMWNFDGKNEAMVFFALQPRPMLNVSWE